MSAVHDYFAAEAYDEEAARIEDPARPPASTWAPIDLDGILDGTAPEILPELMPRSDGVCLLYRRHVHSIHGESESGKSMVMHAESARMVEAGGRVLFLDFESDERTVVGRLLKLGASPDAIRSRFTYVRPETRPTEGASDYGPWLALLSRRFDLAVIDGVTAALGVWGYGSNDNDEVTRWGTALPLAVADKTGAAVVVIDHVTKSVEGRGRFAIGAQAKMSYLTGAAYSVDVIRPLGVGLCGVLSVRVGKDRPGRVREHGTDPRADRTQAIARITVDSTDRERIAYTIEAPGAPGQHGSGFRYTAFMEKISLSLETAGRPLSLRQLRSDVRGDNSRKDAALATLVAEGYATRTPRGVESARPYRQADDPGSDHYEPEDDG